jgi:hypothetical protein
MNLSELLICDGVLYGSDLKSLLSSIIINDLQNVIKHCVRLLFADDANTFRVMQPHNDWCLLILRLILISKKLVHCLLHEAPCEQTRIAFFSRKINTLCMNMNLVNPI